MNTESAVGHLVFRPGGGLSREGMLMSTENSTAVFCGNIMHTHMYALLVAQSRLLGAAQSVFMNDYANTFRKILSENKEYVGVIEDFKTFTHTLKTKCAVKDLQLEPVRGKKYRVILKGCKNAEQNHKTFDLEGSRFM